MAKSKKDTEPVVKDVDSILSAIQNDMNSHFDGNSTNLLSSPDTLSKIGFSVSSRSIIVDSVLRGNSPIGAPLVPFGRIVELSGENNSGKTTLCAQIAAETQAQNGIVIAVDTEERIDENYWEALGVDINRVLRISATDIVDVFNKMYRAVQIAGETAPDRPILLIYDSLGGTSGSEMLDSDSKESIMEQASKFGMRKARLISDGFSAMNTVISKYKVCFLYTNHIYTQIGATSYGPAPTQVPGGAKPKFYSTVRLQLQPCGVIKEVDDASNTEKVIGQRIRVKALKNSMAGILLTREAVVMAGKGFSNEYSVFEMGQKLGLIEKSGSWSVWTSPETGEERKFQGWNGFLEKVVTDPGYPALVAAVEEQL